jgi:hypothetical protein
MNDDDRPIDQDEEDVTFIGRHDLDDPGRQRMKDDGPWHRDPDVDVDIDLDRLDLDLLDDVADLDPLLLADLDLRLGGRLVPALGLTFGWSLTRGLIAFGTLRLAFLRLAFLRLTFGRRLPLRRRLFRSGLAFGWLVWRRLSFRRRQGDRRALRVLVEADQR